MKSTPEQLEQQGYMPVKSLNHQEIIPFVQEYIKKSTWSARFYWGFNVLVLLAAGFFWGASLASEKVSFLQLLQYSGYAFLLFFPMILVHEYLHVIAYKLVGAEKTSLGANWKKLYFMALADRFVANRKEFRFIALLPFVVISSIFILWAVMAAPEWRITALVSLAVHTACCAGDFGLLSYFEYEKENEIVTYDVVEEGISYFLSAPKASH